MESVTLEQVQSQLPADSALIEFMRYSPYDPKQQSYGEPRYAAYLLKPNGQVLGVDLGAASDLEAPRQLLQRFQASLDGNSPITDSQSVGRKLYRRLMGKLEPHLVGVNHLLIAPDHQLNLLPFSALVDESGQYLVQRFRTISHLNSGRELREVGLKTSSRHPSLLVGNPHEEDEQALKQEVIVALGIPRGGNPLKHHRFPSLPYSAEEVRNIKAQYLPNAVVMLGADAHEAAVKQTESPRILHLATHGFFVDDAIQHNIEHPLLKSGIILAKSQGTKENGILTALEVAGMNLKGTELVVLSACETGKGEVIAGEGVYGLRRAFSLAGAQSQIMALWTVEDASIKRFMVQYYQQLIQSGLGRGEALNKIQQAFIESEDYKHPYYWASLLLTENGTPG